MQLPVLGTLFKSRDYINHQTELMMLVTPYIVHAVAQKELSRPDDGFADPSDPSTMLLGRLNRIYGAAGKTEPQPATTIAASTASFSIERRETIDDSHSNGDRQTPRPAGAAAAGASSASPRCSPAATRRSAPRRTPYPTDYRERHPITLKEGEHTVEIFIGRNRGGLTAERSAPTCWPSRSTGGARRPAASSSTCRRAGRPTAPPPIRCAKSIRSSPPPACRRSAVYVRGYRPSRVRARQHQAQLFQAGRATPAPAGCGRTISARRATTATYNENRPYWNLGCATPAQPRRHGRQPGRPGAAARRNAGL